MPRAKRIPTDGFGTRPNVAALVALLGVILLLAAAIDIASRPVAPEAATVAAVSAAPSAVTATPTSTAAPAASIEPPLSASIDLDAALNQALLLAGEAPGDAVTSVAVALPGGQLAGVNEDALIVSASAAKVYWTVAAVAWAGLDAVAPYATDTFAWSDNLAAAAVIDLVGIETINAFLREAVGLRDTGLMQWQYGAERFSTSYPGPLGGENYTTTSDAVTFLLALARGRLVPARETAVILQWMTLTPRNQGDVGDWGGILGDRLPPPAQAGIMHKAGWLTPGTIDETTSAVIDIGIVPLPGGSWYAIALQASGPVDTSTLADYLARVSCEVYVRVSGDPVTCAAP